MRANIRPITAPISVLAADRILACFAPLFRDGPDGNPEVARIAAAQAAHALPGLWQFEATP